MREQSSQPAVELPLDAPASAVPAARNQYVLEKAARYAIAAIGPIGSAATQFLLSLLMLKLLPPGQFGTFSFLLVASQLSWGIWSALFCAPLPVFLARGNALERERGEATLVSMNALTAGLSFMVFAGIAFVLGLGSIATLCYAAYGATALLRWFGRAYAYVHGRQLRTTLSDVLYSGLVIASLAVTYLVLHLDAQTACYASLFVGAVGGLLPFGRSYLGRLGAWRPELWRGYVPIWRDQARWALTGVITTEATANAHVYLITMIAGPAAYAPVAASALLLRPVNVAQNALSDFERPQMARLISEGHKDAIKRSLVVFRLALAGVWICTIAGGVALFFSAPRIIFPPAYDLHFVMIAALLWSVFAALRLMQTPESTLLQAAGEFRDLALASIWSSIGSVAAVLLLLVTAGTLWSIGGIIAGAAIYYAWTHRFAARWQRQFSDAPSLK